MRSIVFMIVMKAVIGYNDNPIQHSNNDLYFNEFARSIQVPYKNLNEITMSRFEKCV